MQLPNTFEISTPYLTISADDQSLCPTDARTGGYTNGDD